MPQETAAPFPSTSRSSIATEPSQGAQVSPPSNEQPRLQRTDTTPAQPVASSEGTTKDGLFSALKDVLPILIVYSYFAGWIYAYAFFRSFHVPLASLGIPLQYFFMYSFSALASWRGALLILVAAALISWLQKQRVAMVVVACLLFPLVFSMALVQGTTDAASERNAQTNDRVLLSFKTEAMKSIPSDLQFNNQNERLRLLADTKERILVFYQPAPFAGNEIPPALVYDIAKSDLTIIKRQVTDKGKESITETLRRFFHE
jgi:hypothetical protein